MKHKRVLSKVIIFLLAIFALTGCKRNFSNNIELNTKSYNASDKAYPSAPTEDEIIKQINLGISIIEEAIENFVKQNPGKKPEDAWQKVLDIRDSRRIQ